MIKRAGPLAEPPKRPIPGLHRELYRIVPTGTNVTTRRVAGAVRLTGASLNTVAKLLTDAADADAAYHDERAGA